MKNKKTINLVARNFQILQWAAKVEHPRIKSSRDLFCGVMAGILARPIKHHSSFDEIERAICEV